MRRPFSHAAYLRQGLAPKHLVIGSVKFSLFFFGRRLGGTFTEWGNTLSERTETVLITESEHTVRAVRSCKSWFRYFFFQNTEKKQQQQKKKKTNKQTKKKTTKKKKNKTINIMKNKMEAILLVFRITLCIINAHI